MPYPSSATSGVRGRRSPQPGNGQDRGDRSGDRDSIRQYGLRIDFLPERFVAESVAEGFPVPAGRHVVLVRAEEARDVLPALLAARGATVDILPVYRTVAEDVTCPDLTEIDVITFTSASTVKNFRARYPGEIAGPIIACIGPVTAQTAREMGLHVDITALEYTVPALVAALEQYYLSRPNC